MMEQAIATYREEAGELLAELETSLLELEENPQDDDLINRVFRAMHTIKGSGAMFGFDDIARFTHEVETVFDQVRNGKLFVTRPLLDLTLQARDQISTMLQASAGGPPADEAVGQQIIAGLQALLPQSAPPAADEAKADKPAAAQGEACQRTYRIRFRPAPEVMLGGTNPLNLLNELRSLGRCEIVTHLDAIPLLGDLVPEQCHFYWDIIITTPHGMDALKDVFIFVEDDCELKIDLVNDTCAITAEGDANYKNLGEILVERGDLSPVEMQKILSMQKRFGELLVEQGIVPSSKVEAALLEQKEVRQARQQHVTQDSALSIRVPAERLDYLVNLVGELVTVQAHLSQTADEKNDGDIITIAEEVERLISELRDTTLTMRMLPIGSTFSKFKRLVRDLSTELGKEIDLETSGAETELDKTVIEKLNDPLVHLIRNSIDHGIEMPEVRRAAGKAPKGDHPPGGRTLRRQRTGYHPRRRRRTGQRGDPRQGHRAWPDHRSQRTVRQRDLQPDLRPRFFHRQGGHQRLRPRRGDGCGQKGDRGVARQHRHQQHPRQGLGDHPQDTADPGHHRNPAGAD